MSEPNSGPATLLTTPRLPMEMAISGMPTAPCRARSQAVSRLRTSPLLCGITATLAISAPAASAAHKVARMLSADGVA